MGSAPGKALEGGAHLGRLSTARGEERWRLVGVLRWRRSPVAGDSGDEVLLLEEGMREVREHLAEEKVARGSSSKGWGGWRRRCHKMRQLPGVFW
jgi:hypothetical protein